MICSHSVLSILSHALRFSLGCRFSYYMINVMGTPRFLFLLFLFFIKIIDKSLVVQRNEFYLVLEIRIMDTTTNSSANSGFVGIKFCQEWLVKVYSFILIDFRFCISVIICSIPKKIRKIEYYSMQYI